jgi:hypothetical protein
MSCLIRGVASLEEDNLVVFYYLRAFEFWYELPYKRKATPLMRQLLPDFKCSEIVKYY